MNTESKPVEQNSNNIDSTTQNQSIHDFHFELICEYFSYLERQGPGSKEATLRALSFIENLTDKSIAKKEGYNDRPKEINDFWMDAYPEIDVISAKIAQMEKAGYKTVAHFTLPGSCWLDGYYASQKNSRDLFLRKYGEHQVAVDFVAIMQHEEAMYNKYKEFYGYAFYIGKKI